MESEYLLVPKTAVGHVLTEAYARAMAQRFPSEALGLLNGIVQSQFVGEISGYGGGEGTAGTMVIVFQTRPVKQRNSLMWSV